MSCNTVLVREAHPRVRASLSLKRYLSEAHVLVAPHGGPGGVVDARLHEQGRSRRVVARVAHFVSATFVAAETDLLLTCPSGLAAAVREPLRLKVPPTNSDACETVSWRGVREA